MGKNTEPLWNNTWLKAELTKKFPEKTVVDKDVLSKTTPVIDFKEKKHYDEFIEEIERQLEELEEQGFAKNSKKAGETKGVKKTSALSKFESIDPNEDGKVLLSGEVFNFSKND